MTTYEEDLFQVLRETFMEDEFYINDKNEPTFLIICTQHYPSKWQIYIRGLGTLNTYSSHAKALNRLKEIVENANVPVEVYRKTKHRKKKLLFAENKETRINLDKIPEGIAYKVFEFSEFNALKK